MNIKFYLKLMMCVLMLSPHCRATLLDTITQNRICRQSVYNGDHFDGARSINEYTHKNNGILRDESNVDAKRRASDDEKKKIAKAVFGAAWADLTVTPDGSLTPAAMIDGHTHKNPYNSVVNGRVQVKNSDLQNHFQILYWLDNLARAVVQKVIGRPNDIINADFLSDFSDCNGLYGFNGFEKETVAKWLESVRVGHAWRLSARQGLAQGNGAGSEIKDWYVAAGTVCGKSPIPALKRLPVFSDAFCAKADFPKNYSVAGEFPKDTGVGYTIEEHTNIVVAGFFEFSDSIQLPESVNKRDFVLLLSLHDIGKNLSRTKARTGSIQKDWELIYSRRMFKHVARDLGINPKTVKILSRLLHADTIDNYLKGCTTAAVTYELLVRDANKCLLPVQTFFDLHMSFHKLDAGAYPYLKGLLLAEGSLVYKDGAKTKIDTLQSQIDVSRLQSIPVVPGCSKLTSSMLGIFAASLDLSQSSLGG